MHTNRCGMSPTENDDFETTDSHVVLRQNGVEGVIDYDTGRLIVSGKVVASIADLSSPFDSSYETGKIGGKLKKIIKRVVKMTPLGMLTSQFKRIATSGVGDREFETDEDQLVLNHNGVNGVIDYNTGCLRVAGQVVATASDLARPIAAYEGYETGKIGGKLRKIIKKVVKLSPLGMLTSQFKRIATSGVASGASALPTQDFETSDNYLTLNQNGVQGLIDYDTGALVVSGQVVMVEPDLSAVQFHVVGRIGDRLRGVVKRIVKAAPLRKLAGAFGKLAGPLAQFMPPPYNVALSAAARIGTIASHIGRGDTGARASVANLAQTALSVTNPNNARARTALNAINDMAEGRVPPQAAAAFQTASTAARVAEGLMAGNPDSLATARQLASLATGNHPQGAAARVGLHALRAAFRERATTTSGPETAEIREAARVLWGVIRPHIGVRPSAELTMRDAYINGVNLMASMVRR